MDEIDEILPVVYIQDKEDKRFLLEKNDKINSFLKNTDSFLYKRINEKNKNKCIRIKCIILLKEMIEGDQL